MAVLFLMGTLNPCDAQNYLETQVEKILYDKVSLPEQERMRACAKEELRWLAAHGMADLYLLLAKWTRLLQENKLAWWCSLPRTPVVGWLLGIRQAKEDSAQAWEALEPEEEITLLVSELGEKMLLAVALRQPSQLESPERYIPIRWNCFWPKAVLGDLSEGTVPALLKKPVCSVFRYDGLAQLERLERDTGFHRRDQAMTSEEIRDCFLAPGWVNTTEQSKHLFLMQLLWQEAKLPESPTFVDKAALDEMLKFSGVQGWFEDLALALLLDSSWNAGGDPVSFSLSRSMQTKTGYRCPTGTALPAMQKRQADERDSTGKVSIDAEVRWADRLQHLFAPQYLRGICEIQLRIDYYRRHHPLDWRRVMEAETPEVVSEELTMALEALASTSVRLEEYHALVKAGVLADYERLSFSLGDRKFEQRYPEHPMAERNLRVRMGAADFIRDLAASRLSYFPEIVLDKLHELLFDCSGAVRHSLTTALYHAGNLASVAALNRLVQEETGSAMVRDTAEVAALRCRQRGAAVKDVPLEKSALSLVSSNVALAIEMNRFAKQVGCQLVFPEPQTLDLAVFPAVVRVVNRREQGIAGWKAFVELCQDPAPLILIDGFLPDEEAAWGAPPCSWGGVCRAEEWMVDWIIEKIGEFLANERTWAGNSATKTERKSN